MPARALRLRRRDRRHVRNVQFFGARVRAMAFKVFYAWQSDRDETHGRFLIRNAAKRAIKRVAAAAQVSEAPSLDHDTKGEPGTPHIARTIERKIRQCGVFLADLT